MYLHNNEALIIGRVTVNMSLRPLLLLDPFPFYFIFNLTYFQNIIRSLKVPFLYLPPRPMKHQVCSPQFPPNMISSLILNQGRHGSCVVVKKIPDCYVVLVSISRDGRRWGTIDDENLANCRLPS